MKTNNNFPVEYDGKNYYEKDCDDIFLAFYEERFQLNGDGGVYMSEDIWVYPDGTMDEY